MPKENNKYDVIEKLIYLGASVKIDAGLYSTEEIERLVYLTGTSKGKIVLYNLSCLDDKFLERLTYLGKNNIELEFSDLEKNNSKSDTSNDKN